MSASKRPTTRIVTVGPSHHGKTTLTRAIVQAAEGNESIRSHRLDPPKGLLEVTYSTGNFQIEHIDATTERNDLNWAIERLRPEGALVVLSASADGAAFDLIGDQLRLVASAGIHAVVGVVNKVDLAPLEQVRAVEGILRAAIAANGLGKPVIVHTSAKKALEGDLVALEGVRGLIFAEDVFLAGRSGIPVSPSIESALVAGIAAEVARKRRDGEDAVYLANDRILRVPSHDL
jgi:translation elongation factor EF-Tu-like GTPase